ncbi:lysophospholipid acyltransferase family protein [Sulfurimonas sp.]
MFDIKTQLYKNYKNVTDTLPTPIINLIIYVLRKLLHEDDFNKVYEKVHYLRGVNFVEGVLEALQITYVVKPNEIKNIPSTGRLLVIANHITGMQDSFSLVELIANHREDKKVRLMINGSMSWVEQAQDIVVPVDNINGRITKESLKVINETLQNEEVVIIFPAGVVNRWSLKGLKDIAWQSSFLKIAKRNETPILPVRIEGKNSFLFYFFSFILPLKLSALFLPHEFAMARKKQPLKFNIGKVIPIRAFESKDKSLQEYVELFYKHLYQIGTHKGEVLPTETTINPPNNRVRLKEEVQKAEFLGNTLDGKRIILVDALHAPFLIAELGRVREISFRAIGGGTGDAQDNDLYDNYYRHLILWDDEDLEIVGAYRIGECQDIIANRGMQGLYTYNLCNFSEHFNEYCNNSVELGRSFVQPKYWGSRALDNLWQGVGAYLASNERIRYTYGTVTINADTPQKAVAALVYFYSSYFNCHTGMMRAKTPYKMSAEDKKEFGTLFYELSYKEGFAVLKRYLKDLGTSVPTLFKQYAELYDEGAVRFFDFSVNEELHGVVEGFIIADNSRMKESKKKRYIKNFQNS